MAVSKRKPRAAKAPKAAVPAAPAPAKAGSKTRFWIPLALLAAVLGLGAQIYVFTRKTVDLEKEFVYVGKVCKRGADQGMAMGSYAMTNDAKGHFFNLDLEGEDVRVQEFTLDGKYLGKSKLKGDEKIKSPYEIAADSLGACYVLERATGTVVKLNPDLKFAARIRFETDKITGLTVNDKDELVVVDYARGGFLKAGLDGKVKAFVPVKDTDIVSAWRLAAVPGGRYVVLYNLNNSIVLATYSEEGALLKKWKSPIFPPSPAGTFGIDKERRIYLNDGAGNSGVHAYSFTGKYLGNAKTAGPGLDFLNQGCLSVDRFSSKLFLNTPMGIDMVEFKWK